MDAMSTTDDEPVPDLTGFDAPANVRISDTNAYRISNHMRPRDSWNDAIGRVLDKASKYDDMKDADE